MPRKNRVSIPRPKPVPYVPEPWSRVYVVKCDPPIQGQVVSVDHALETAMVHWSGGIDRFTWRELRKLVAE